MCLDQFYGLKSAFELKFDGITTIANCLGFPKMPFKSRLSLFIIKIIVLKDKRFPLKKYKIGKQAAAHTNRSVLLNSSTFVDN